MQKRDVEFLRRHTDRRIRVTVPGPFTMSQQAQDDYYGDEAALALDLAVAVNLELHDAVAAGAEIVQIDEPYLQARPAKAREYAIGAIDRALEGIETTTALHTCFGYAAIVKNRADGYSFLSELDGCTVDEISIEAAQPRLDPAVLQQLPSKTIVLGTLDLGDLDVEPPKVVADRIRAALAFVPPERLVLAPDCGMKYLPLEIAQRKLASLVEGASMVRRSLTADQAVP